MKTYETIEAEKKVVKWNNKDKLLFNDFIKNDNVIKIENNKFQTQCTMYGCTFSLKGLKVYFQLEYNFDN